MAKYTAHISQIKEFEFLVNIVPANYTGYGNPPVKCSGISELIDLMLHLDLDIGAQNMVLSELDSDMTITVGDVELTDDIAAEYGWPKN